MFGRNRKPYVVPPPPEPEWKRFMLSSSPQSVKSRVRFMKTLTREKYQTHYEGWLSTFKEYSSMLRKNTPEVRTTQLNSTYQLSYLTGLYEKLVDEVFRLRFTAATDDVLQRVWWILFELLPKLEGSIKLSTQQMYTHTGYPLMVKERLLLAYKIAVEATRLGSLKLAEVVDHPYAAVEHMEIDGLAPDMDENVQKLIEECKTVISGLPDRVLSAENAFFVEESIQTYIPESLNLLKQFAGSSVHLEEAAKQNVVRQLKLIHEKLVSISDEMHQKVLDELNVHESFLQERITRL